MTKNNILDPFGEESWLKEQIESLSGPRPNKNRLECCRPTAYDGSSQTLVHGPECATPDQLLSEEEFGQWRADGRARASAFNHAAEQRALARAAARTQAMDDHPAGKGPRYRASQLWISCSCRTPMAGECKVHGGAL